MMTQTFIVLVSLTMSAILAVAACALMKKVSPTLQSASPFECGFSPSMNARKPFAVQFFLIALIFLVFDIEIILAIPSLSGNHPNSQALSSGLALFFTLVIAGLFYEWMQKALQWKK